MFTHFEEEGIHAFFQSGIDGEKLLHDGSGDSLRGGGVRVQYSVYTLCQCSVTYCKTDQTSKHIEKKERLIFSLPEKGRQLQIWN